MRLYRDMVIVIILAMLLVVSGCNSDVVSTRTQKAADLNCAGDSCISPPQSALQADVQKIEIYHFHGANQCASCIAVGKLAEETVNTYYPSEVSMGKIVFAHVNADLPENREKVMRYGATGSSLWIGTYTSDGQFKAEQNTDVWYKIGDRIGYMGYLKVVIDKRLAGDYS